MSRSLKVSRPLNTNMIFFVHISNLFKYKVMYIMTFSIERCWILEKIVLHFSIQREDIIEHTNDKVSYVNILVCKEDGILEHAYAKCHLCTL